MSLDAAIKAHTQLAECRQPGVHAFDHPAVAPEPVIALVALAPRELGTLPPSMFARLKSRRPALRSSASNIRCSWCHTPAACSSRSLRQRVMPLPKPSSWGRSSQAMPVHSTKRMPLRASLSSRRGRPSWGEGFTTGISGSRRFHSAELIFSFVLVRRRTHHPFTAMTGIVGLLLVRFDASLFDDFAPARSLGVHRGGEVLRRGRGFKNNALVGKPFD